MKKLLMYITLTLIFVFLPPFILTVDFNKTNSVFSSVDNNVADNEVDNNDSNKNTFQIVADTNPYSYSEFEKINLLDSATGEVSEIDLDEYLLGVVSAEMPASYEIEALKAQAVVARTYAIYTMKQNKHGDLTICNSSSCCQAWLSKEERMEKWEEDVKESNWNKIVQAVYSTKGQVITYDGVVIDAFFHANSGGVTEEPANVWGGDFPYLKSVQTSGEENYKQYSSERTISKDEIEQKMIEKNRNFSINWDAADCISIPERTENGRVRFVKIGNVTISGVEARSLFELKSTNFNVMIDDSAVTFSVIGYGHGVGMSQTGADSMAKEGASYIDIIKHFYTGVEIINI